MLLRDHRPQAGQWAFRPATHRPSVAASAGTGAAGHSIARRGSLAFRQAAEQPQPATQDKPSSQKVSDRQETPKRALIQRQRPSARQYSPFKKSARSRQRTEDSCPACEGRGFQIVEEELQACPACNGHNWSPPSQTPPSYTQAYLADPPASHFWSPETLSTADATSPSASAAPFDAPDSQTGSVKVVRRGSRSGPKTQAEKDKIRDAMLGRKWTEEHKQNMSEAQKQAWSASRRLQLSKTMTDRPKVCSHCGQQGHNRAGCPVLHPEKKERPSTTGSRPRRAANPVTELKPSSASRKPNCNPPKFSRNWNETFKCFQERVTEAVTKEAKKTACSHCGEVGHNKRRCPQLAHERQQEEEQKLQKQRGPLWGLAGVEEQRMPGGRNPVLVFPVPLQVQDTVNQAANAVMRAQEAGIRRQKVEMLLPQAGVTSAQGSWPGGIRQQAQVAIPSLIEPLLRQLKQQEALQGRMTAEWMDESDCVGAWQNERLAAVLFPTADSLPQVRQMARVKGPHRLMLVINPQWQTDGQIVSDFGFGRAKADAQKFLTSFQDVYCLERVRVMGDDVRLLKCYPGDWQVHYTWPNGKGSLLVGVEPTRPSYARLVEMLKGAPNTRASRSWVDRVLDINNLKGVSGDVNSSLARGSYSDKAAPAAASTSASTAASAPAAEQKKKRPSLRQRLQAALQEQQAAESKAAPSNHQQAAGARQGAAPHPTTGVSQGAAPRQPAGASQGAPPLPLARHSSPSQHQTSGADDLHRAAPRSAPGSAQGSRQGSAQGSGPGSGQGSVPQQQQQETRQAGPGGAVLARPDTAANKAKRAGGRASKRGTGDSGSGDDLASPVADAQPASGQEEEEALKASRQQSPSAAHALHQGEAAQQQRQEGLSQQRGRNGDDRGQTAGAASSRSIDGDDDGMLDRFGTVDIMTGKPVRDLKLDPVRQLVKWRESFFGSRDSVSESLDKDDEGPST